MKNLDLFMDAAIDQGSPGGANLSSDSAGVTRGS
jgi:hypothetical protein